MCILLIVNILGKWSKKSCKKVVKKVQKNLEVKKKVVPLQPV